MGGAESAVSVSNGEGKVGGPSMISGGGGGLGFCCLTGCCCGFCGQ